MTPDLASSSIVYRISDHEKLEMDCKPKKVADPNFFVQYSSDYTQAGTVKYRLYSLHFRFRLLVFASPLVRCPIEYPSCLPLYPITPPSPPHSDNPSSRGRNNKHNNHRKNDNNNNSLADSNRLHSSHSRTLSTCSNQGALWSRSNGDRSSQRSGCSSCSNLRAPRSNRNTANYLKRMISRSPDRSGCRNSPGCSIKAYCSSCSNDSPSKRRTRSSCSSPFPSTRRPRRSCSSRR